MNIQDFVESYLASHDVSQQYTRRLRKRADKLAKFWATDSMAELLTEDRVNRFLASLTTVSPWTVDCYRGDIITLWNAAADLDFVPYPKPRRIRRPKRPALVIDCYTVDEARAILEASRNCHRYVCRNLGFNRRLYWPAIIQLAWDTGLRRGDCWNFRKSWVRQDGSARVVQGKTGKIVTVRLHPSTVTALDKIPFDQPCRWSSVGNSGRFCRQFRDIAKAAGVNRGSFKWLRRSSGSYVDLAQPGAGGKQLGHASGDMFRKHYDGQLGGHNLPMAPELGCSNEAVATQAAPLPDPPPAPAFDEFAFL